MAASAIVHTPLKDSAEAGLSIGHQVLKRLGDAPDALLLLCTQPHDYRRLIEAVHASCRPKTLVGGTVPTGFTHHGDLDGSVFAIGLRSKELVFSPAVAHAVSRDHRRAAGELASSLKGRENHAYLYRSAIVFTDARAQFADTFIEELNALSGGTYQLFGGGCAVDPLVSDAFLFHQGEVLSDATVALEILSNRPLGVSVFHGWKPASRPFRVTQAQGRRLVSLNAQPAVDAFLEYAESTRQRFDPKSPQAFFLENILGISLPDGHKLRVPLAALEDGSIVTATEIPEESIVHVMRTGSAAAAEIADNAVSRVREQMGHAEPELAIFFDCLAARIRHRMGFGVDLRTLQGRLGTEQYVVLGTAGQTARADGQFTGFHNSTSVVCVFPR